MSNRLRERLILLGVELDLVLVLALAVFLFHLDRRLAPLAHEEMLAVAGAVPVFAARAVARAGAPRALVHREPGREGGA